MAECKGAQCKHFGRCEHEPEESGECFEPVKRPSLARLKHARLSGDRDRTAQLLASYARTGVRLKCAL